MNKSIHNRLPVTIALIAIAIISQLYGSTYYVASGSKHAGSGTELDPFTSLDFAIQNLTAGDTLLVRGGEYKDAVISSGLEGTAENPIVIMAYPGEAPIFNGTVPIKTKWRKHKGRIYKTKVKQDLWQLFVGGEMAVPARWPNAQYADSSVWDQKRTWAHGDAKKGRNGLLVDVPAGDNDLAATGMDITGAIGILNVGSFTTRTKIIESHTAGTDSFTYEPVKGYRAKHHYYYLEGKLGFLDSPNEWFYDKKQRLLYLWAPDSRKPSGNIVGKVQTYALEFSASSHIIVQGFNFFGTTVKFENCTNVTLADCNFNYPSYTGRMIGDLVHEESTVFLQRNNKKDSYCSIINCTFRNIDGHALYVQGGYNRMENCFFENIDYSVSSIPGLMVSILFEGHHNIIRRNTIHTCAASSTVSPGAFPIFELNHIWDTGFLQSDGSITQCKIPEQPNSKIRYNWFRDTVKSGARFDAPIPPRVWGNGGQMDHNVVMRTNMGLMLKGERHFCYNNTTFETKVNGIIILDDIDVNGGANKGTITRNNLSDNLSGHRKLFTPVPGDADHNWNGYEKKAGIGGQLRDITNWDFRPRPDSDIIDGGVVVEGVTDGYEGSLPDIGAYEAGAPNYWIPGRQTNMPSTPIPHNAGPVAQPDADLMWLSAYKSTSSDVYFGEQHDGVTKADTKSSSFCGNQQTNIYDPGDLVPGKTYYWRIDDHVGDKIVEGPTWQFTVKAD